MIKVRTLDTVDLGSGMVVGLSKKQAVRRSRFLEGKIPKEGFGKFKLTGLIQLKKGEDFEIDKIPKALSHKLDPLGKPEKKAPKKADKK